MGTPYSNAAASLHKVGFTTRGYTDPQASLRSLGSGWLSEEITYQQLLSDPSVFKRFDAVFLSSSLSCADKGLVDQVEKPLRAYVEQGGIVWGADWALSFLQTAFPEYVLCIDERGDAQKVRAHVDDSALSGLLGDSDISVSYPLDNWRVLSRSTSRPVTVCLQGEALVEGDKRSDQVLMSAFTLGNGHVIASTMGMESFTPECRDKILRFILVRGLLSQAVLPQGSADSKKGGSPAGFTLKITSAGQEQSVPISDGKLDVGRDADNGLSLPNDPTISGEHCRFVAKNGELYLEPRNNKNPLLVNDREITHRERLYLGNVIKLGDNTVASID